VDIPIAQGRVLDRARHPDFQPFADQSDHLPVADQMFNKAYQPVMINRVAELSDVRVHYPVHLALGDPNRRCIQRIVLAAFRPKSMAKS
jgi:hypothetical protein